MRWKKVRARRREKAGENVASGGWMRGGPGVLSLGDAFNILREGKGNREERWKDAWAGWLSMTNSFAGADAGAGLLQYLGDVLVVMMLW
jgi:hypothetical protein